MYSLVIDIILMPTKLGIHALSHFISFRYMDKDITFRWIDGWNATPEEWERIEEILVARGWMVLNPNTSRILVAEKGDVLAGFAILQLVPHVEPLFVAP